MKTFAGFLLNNRTQEHFVAPVAAEAFENAIGELSKAYKAPFYTVLTAYEVGELRGILDDIARWPGVPSNVQAAREATLDEKLARVSSHVGKLPPLVREKPNAGHVDSADTAASLTAMMRLMEEQRKMREAQLAKVMNKSPAMALKPADAQAEKKVAATEKTAKVPVETAPALKPSPAVAANNGKSVLEVLRAMRS